MNEMTNANEAVNAVTAAGGMGDCGIFADTTKFQAMVNMATFMARSNIIPAAYIGNPSNVLIATDMALRLGTSPMMVMQNLYIVHGQPAWKASFLIAMVNRNKKFTGLEYEFSGEKDDYGCAAFSHGRDGKVLKGTKVTWKMVKAEGWDKKNGSKWATMPEQMFIYRAAAFWIRMYAPDLALGIRDETEAEDAQAAREVAANVTNAAPAETAPAETAPAPGRKLLKAAKKKAAAPEPAPAEPAPAEADPADQVRAEIRELCRQTPAYTDYVKKRLAGWNVAKLDELMPPELLELEQDLLHRGETIAWLRQAAASMGGDVEALIGKNDLNALTQEELANLKNNVNKMIN